MELIES
jgi:hypothetical protein